MQPTDAPAWAWSLLSKVESGLAGLQVSLNFIKDDQATLRQRLHDLANQLTPLMNIPEQLKEVRREQDGLRGRLDRLDAIANTGKGAALAAGAISGFIGVIAGIGLDFARILLVGGRQ